VASTNTVPGNWQEFLRVPENRPELFQYLATQAAENLPTKKEVFPTYKQNVLTCSIHQDVSGLSPSTQEEADSKMFLRVGDAIAKGHQKVMIRSVDSDVLVLAVCCASLAKEAELWVAFCVGNKKRYMSVPPSDNTQDSKQNGRRTIESTPNVSSLHGV